MEVGAVAAAVATLVLIGVLPLLSGNDGTPSAATVVPTPPTPVAETVVPVTTSPQGNATCPSGSNPDILGPPDQERPWGSFLEQSGCRVRCARRADHLHG